MPDTTMEFDGDASPALAEIQKLIAQQKALEKAVQTQAKTAETGAKLATTALQQQSQAVKSLSSENERLKKKLDEAKGATMTLGSFGQSAMMGIGSAITSKVLGGLEQMISLTTQYRKEMAAAALEQDKVGKKLQVQGLMSDKELQKTIKQRIAPAAQKTGVSLMEAQGVATELLSQGFSKEDATGGGLEELLAGAQATNTEDKKQFATAVAGVLKSRGKKLTKENVRSVTQPLAAIFGPTAVQGADLDALTQISAMLKEKNIDQTESLAAFAVLKDIGGAGAEKSATGLRAIVSKLAGQAGNKEVSDILRKIGGKKLQDATDLVGGETFEQALHALNDAMSGLDEQSRNAAMSKIFGEEHQASATTLMANLGKLREFQNVQHDDTVLKKGFEIKSSGIDARNTRLENQQQIDLMEVAKQEEEKEAFSKALDTEMKARGVNAVSRKIVHTTLDTNRAFGKDKLSLAAGTALAAAGHSPTAILEATQKRMAAAGEGGHLAKMELEPLAPLPEIKHNMPVGPKRHLDVLGDGTEEERKMQLKIEEAETKADRIKVDAQQKGSPGANGGTAISKAEQKLIDEAEAQTNILKQMLKESQLKNRQNSVVE